MVIVMAIAFVCCAVGATAVVFTREPAAQAVVLGVYGLLLSVMFFLLQAPDVALSQLAVGGIAFPVLILLTIAKLRREAQRLRHERESAGSVEDADA